MPFPLVLNHQEWHRHAATARIAIAELREQHVPARTQRDLILPQGANDMGKMSKRIYIPTDDVGLRSSIKAHNTAARKALAKKHGTLSDGTLDIGVAGIAKLLEAKSKRRQP